MLLRPNPSSGVPIYLQLMEQVKHGIETGALRPGEQLPGIRPLAEELVINPNTVAKAYRELEHEGSHRAAPRGRRLRGRQRAGGAADRPAARRAGHRHGRRRAAARPRRDGAGADPDRARRARRQAGRALPTAPTTISPSPSRWPNSRRGCMRWCGAHAASSIRGWPADRWPTTVRGGASCCTARRWRSRRARPRCCACCCSAAASRCRSSRSSSACSPNDDEVHPEAVEVFVYRLRKRLDGTGCASSRCAAWATCSILPDEHSRSCKPAASPRHCHSLAACFAAWSGR